MEKDDSQGNEDQQKQQEMMQKLQMYDQHMQQLKKQFQAVEQGIKEVTQISSGLEELKGSEGKEILAPIGRGIYAKVKLISEDLIVDIGEGNMIKKSIDDTKNIISEQVEKLEDVKKDLNSNMGQIQQELQKMLTEAQ